MLFKWLQTRSSSFSPNTKSSSHSMHNKPLTGDTSPWTDSIRAADTIKADALLGHSHNHKQTQEDKSKANSKDTHRRTHEHTPFKLHTQNLSASKINGCLSTHTGNRQTARWGLSGENTIQDKLCEKKEVNGLHRFIETRSLYFWLKRPKLSEEAGRGPVPETQYVYDCFSGGCVS